MLVVLAGVLCLGMFSPEIRDSDFWWHLRTGQYIVETRWLPVPDPFAYTTAAAPLAYPGEDAVRHFNLTHEWLAQAILYCIYATAGAPGGPGNDAHDKVYDLLVIRIGGFADKPHVNRPVRENVREISGIFN